jgi:hypothetical protein
MKLIDEIKSSSEDCKNTFNASFLSVSAWAKAFCEKKTRRINAEISIRGILFMALFSVNYLTITKILIRIVLRGMKIRV